MADRAGAAGYYIFHVAGQQPASVSKVTGGDHKVDGVTHKMGSEKANQHMIGNVSFTDLKLDMGMSLGGGMKEWIDATLKANTDYLRQDCAVDYADYNRKVISTINCTGCLIKKVTFPALDGKGKDALKISVEIGVERTEHAAGGGAMLQGKVDPAQKHMVNNMFTVTMPGYPEKAITKVDAISIEQKTTLHYFGWDRQGRLEPVDLGDIDVTIHFAVNKDEEKQIRSLVHSIHTLGEYDHTKDIDIRIAWLKQNGKDEIGALNLLGCIPLEATKDDAESGKEAIHTIKVKLRATYIDLSEVKLSQ
jgi:phage tail-like protein